jgi:hypothetical protein
VDVDLCCNKEAKEGNKYQIPSASQLVPTWAFEMYQIHHQHRIQRFSLNFITVKGSLTFRKKHNQPIYKA